MKVTCPFILWMSQSLFREWNTVLVTTFDKGHRQPEFMKKRVQQIIKGLKAML